MTQKQLAGMLGVQHNTISTWENGTNSIDASVLMRICEYLDVSLDDMFGKESKNTPIAGMSKDEMNLIMNYRKLSRDNQALLFERIDTMLELSATKEEYENQVKRA